ncbi:hypothetical protein RA989_21130, partial [Mycobacteroides abscessus subsp. massiliense]
MPPGIDPTSISAQVLVIGRTILALQMLAQFTGQRAIHGIVKDLSAGTYTAVVAVASGHDQLGQHGVELAANHGS